MVFSSQFTVHMYNSWKAGKPGGLKANGRRTSSCVKTTAGREDGDQELEKIRR
jgi:hypothetical protein